MLNNNVYYLPENRNQAIQLTNDGIPGVIYNGHTDWVYEGIKNNNVVFSDISKLEKCDAFSRSAEKGC